MVRMTWYVTSRDLYVASLKGLGPVYRDVMGRNFPAMTCVAVQTAAHQLPWAAGSHAQAHAGARRVCKMRWGAAGRRERQLLAGDSL